MEEEASLEDESDTSIEDEASVGEACRGENISVEENSFTVENICVEVGVCSGEACVDSACAGVDCSCVVGNSENRTCVDERSAKGICDVDKVCVNE